MGAPLSPSSGRKFSYRRPPVSDINITPFVDVVLVLLIVFMVTAPMMTQGVQVQLPQVVNGPITESEEPLEITVKQGGNVYVQNQLVPVAKLSARLSAIAKARTEAAVVIVRADKSVAYGTVMQVMSALQQANLSNVGLVTEPVGGR